MMLTLYLAATLAGIVAFETPQEACTEGMKVDNQLVTVLVVNLDDPRTVEACCDRAYSSFGFRDGCKKKPAEFGCDNDDMKPRWQQKKMRCLSAQSYRLEDAK